MIRIRNVCKSYTLGGGEVKALDNVCFDLPGKGLFFVLGKSGSGKSTLLNVLGGLDKANSGSVVIDGNDILKFGESELDGYRNGYCGFVFQEFNLLPMLNVEENVRLGLSLQGEKDTDLRVKEALASVELSGYEGRNITELSGGQKQRVAIARAIVKGSSLILADEPTGALDKSTGEKIFQLLKKVSEDKAVIVVTHDREAAQKYGDRIIELSDGKIIEGGEVIEEKEEVKKPICRQPKMPLKLAVKMGCSSFKRHVARFVATVLLCALAFSLLCTALIFIYNDKGKIAFNTMVANGVDYASLKKRVASGGNAIPIKDSEVASLQAVFDGVLVYVNAFADVYSSDEEYAFYDVAPIGVAALDYESAGKMGFTVEGRLPTDNSEIAVTQVLSTVFKRRVFGKNESVIGKTLDIDDKKFTIVGVVDTKFNESKYNALKMQKTDTYTSIYGQYLSELQSSAAAFVFVCDIGAYKKTGISLGYGTCDLYSENLSLSEVRKICGTANSADIFWTCDKSGSAVSITFLPTLLSGRKCFFQVGDKQYFDYGELFCALSDMENASVYDYDKVYSKYVELYNFPNSFECLIKDKIFGSELSIEVTGFTKNNDIVFLNQEKFLRMYDSYGGEYDGAIVGVTKSIRSYVEGKNGFYVENYATDIVDGVYEKLSTVKSIVLIFSIMLGFFATAMLVNLLSVSQADKTKEMGVLRANGCSGNGLAKVFFAESFVLCISGYVLSVFLSVIFCIIINSSVEYIALLGQNIFAYLTIFGLMSVFSVMVCMLMTFRLRRLSPIEVISMGSLA